MTDVTAPVTFGYVRPWRGRRPRVVLGGDLKRAWFRYLILAELTTGPGVYLRSPYLVIGRTWTRRGANRRIEKMRRIVR